MYEYNATLVRVVDGDTVILDVDLGFHMRGTLTFRLVGINTPERGEQGWAEAKLYLHELLHGKQLRITTHKGQTFARWLCDITDDGADVATAMLAAGLAVEMRR